MCRKTGSYMEVLSIDILDHAPTGKIGTEVQEAVLSLLLPYYKFLGKYCRRNPAVITFLLSPHILTTR